MHKLSGAYICVSTEELFRCSICGTGSGFDRVGDPSRRRSGGLDPDECLEEVEHPVLYGFGFVEDLVNGREGAIDSAVSGRL